MDQTFLIDVTTSRYVLSGKKYHGRKMASNPITRIRYNELNIQPLWYSGVRCLNTSSRGFDCLDKSVEQHAGLSSDSCM